MGSMQIASTDRSGLSLAQVEGNDIYKMLPQLQSVIEVSGLGERYVKLFAEPEENGRSIDWYIEDGDNIVPVSQLDPVERKEVLGKFGEMVKELQNFAAKLRENPSPTYRNYANYIDKSLTIPSLDFLYSVDGEPVLVNWGFSTGDNDLVDNSKKLLKEIQDKIEDAKESISRAIDEENKQPEPAPQPEPEPAPEPKPEPQQQPQPQPEPEPQPEPQPQSPAATPPAAKPFPKALALGILAAIIAGGIAAWLYMGGKDSGKEKRPDMSWLKGDINVEGLLINEKNQAVDLKLSFAGDDGIGKSYIIEKNQTCEGNVVATPQDNNMVSFAMDTIVCPDKSDYEPFTMLCEKGKTLCVGTNKSGETWRIDVDMKGAD